MPAKYKKWDISKGTLTINGVPVLGLKKGDFITAEFAENRHSTHMSADNHGRHSKNPNMNGTCGIGVASAGPAMSVVQAFVDADEPLIISFVDATCPGAYVYAADAVIEKDPAFVRADVPSDVDWVFTVTQLSYKHASPAEQ